MSYETIDIELVADNCNGKHRLHLTTDVCTMTGEREYWFNLTGEYKGKPIQIDFEELTKSELEEIKTMIELILTAKEY